MRGETMSMPRKRALEKLAELEPGVQEHLKKLAAQPNARDVLHWKGEVRNWLRQMKEKLTHVGKKTAAEWAARIAAYEAALRD